MRAVRRVIIGLGFLMAVLLLLMAATYRSGNAALFPPEEGAEVVEIRVSYSPFWLHAQAAVPRRLIEEYGGPSSEALRFVGPGDWVILGWGDEDYYRERGVTDARLLDFARSMLAPDSPVVVELDPKTEAPTPANTGKPVLRLQLSEDGAKSLVARLDASFDVEDGGVAAVGRGRDRGSQFFLANGGSDLFQNCNHWIADLLHAAGVPTIGLVNTVSPGLAFSLRSLANAERVPGDTNAFEPDLETPPTHSGSYGRIGPDGPLGAQLVFEGWAFSLGGAVVETAPIGLVEAAPRNGIDQDFARMLNVPERSLVGIRQVESVTGAKQEFAVCDGAAPSHLAFGFEANGRGPYEIALAVFAQNPLETGRVSPCAVARYRQP